MTKVSNREEEKLKEKFFNTPTLPGEEKTLKDFEKLQLKNNFFKLQKIIRRKKKSKNFDEVLEKYLEIKSKFGGL